MAADKVVYLDNNYKGILPNSWIVVETEAKKAVLLWDIDNQNDWLWTPEGEREVETIDLGPDGTRCPCGSGARARSGRTAACDRRSAVA